MLSRKEAVEFLLEQPYKLGHLLGFTKLTPLHNDWIMDMMAGGEDSTLQAHRGSYKTTCVSIALAVMLLLMPNLRILFMRKTDTDIKEIVLQVQKILRSPQMQYFCRCIYGSSLKLTTHVAHVEGDEGVAADAHKVETPFQASEAALAQLENQLFHDFMGLRVEKISAGNMTATQINAAYDPLNLKTDQFEYQALKFLSGIFALAGIDAKASFKRSRIVNQLEETQMVLLAAEHLDEETLLNKLSWLTPEEVSAVLERKASESLNRFGAGLEV